MLGYNERKRKAALATRVLKIKSGIRTGIVNNKKRITSLCALAALCFALFVFIIPSISLEQFMPFKKITPKNLNKISEASFRNIIGYDYGEKIYTKDTAEIRARLKANSMIFGDVEFFVNLIPYELEIKFNEASPLFTLMPRGSDSLPVIYSDNGKIYPYSANTADLPVVDAQKPGDIALATSFLMSMRQNDVVLYSRVSQLIPSESERQITVFFNDVDFKIKFSLESDYWPTAFRHYRQLTRNMKALNINLVAVLDLRFRQLAYTIDKEARL
ncbi:MAG: hypothetical protein FWC26_13125 [Fibromonadales bacterium]|nr:hypothetical protein [Fibromonadales bacterium]